MAIARCVATPTNLGVEHDAIWSPTIVQFLLPSAAAYLAGIVLALAASRRARALATGLVVGIGLAVGMQSLMGLAYGHARVDVGTGYWVAQGLGIALAVTVVAGWIASPSSVREMASDDAARNPPMAAAWMVIGSFVMLAGSLLPWRKSEFGQTFWNWGIPSPPVNTDDVAYVRLFIVAFALGTFLSLWLPLAALAQRRRLSTPSVLAGWSLTIGLMLLTMELEQHGVGSGFRMMELGSVVTLLGSVAVVAGAAIRRSARARIPQFAAWPPPAATSAD